MELQIKMIGVASEVFSYKKKKPDAIHEEIFQHITNYISQKEKIKDEKIKFAMIAAAGRAFELANKNPGISEKILLREFIEEIPRILYDLEENE